MGSKNKLRRDTSLKLLVMNLVLSFFTFGLGSGLGSDTVGYDWARFFNSLRVEVFVPRRKISLHNGEAVRFSGTVNEWCGQKNTGIKIKGGNGTLLDSNPMLDPIKMNASGDYGMKNTSVLRETSFFVASYTPTTLELIRADWKTLGQDCGE